MESTSRRTGMVPILFSRSSDITDLQTPKQGRKQTAGVQIKVIGFILLELCGGSSILLWNQGAFSNKEGRPRSVKPAPWRRGAPRPQRVGAVEYQKPSVLSPADHDPHMGQIGIEGQIAGRASAQSPGHRAQGPHAVARGGKGGVSGGADGAPG